MNVAAQKPLIERLIDAGSTGLIPSPGDQLLKEAHDELLLVFSHLRGLLFHWNEFGPADGYDEKIRDAHELLKRLDATGVGPQPSPSKPVSGAAAVLKMRDEFLQLVSAYNQTGQYSHAQDAQAIAIALNKFEDDHWLTDITWPARAIDIEGEVELEQVR